MIGVFMAFQSAWFHLTNYVRKVCYAKYIADDPDEIIANAEFQDSLDEFKRRALNEALSCLTEHPEMKYSVFDTELLDISPPVAETQQNQRLLDIMTTELLAKIEKYAATVPVEVAGYIRNFPTWLEQEETKFKAEIAAAIALLTHNDHSVTTPTGVVIPAVPAAVAPAPEPVPVPPLAAVA
jgi:hypothetical protein